MDEDQRKLLTVAATAGAIGLFAGIARGVVQQRHGGWPNFFRGLAASIFAWGAAIERRTAVLEEKARAQVDRDAAQDMAGANAVLLLRNEFSELRNEIRETNRKLDRYLERLGGRP